MPAPTVIDVTVLAPVARAICFSCFIASVCGAKVAARFVDWLPSGGKAGRGLRIPSPPAVLRGYE